MNEIFILLLAILFYSLIAWGVRTLAGERWQIMASIPLEKTPDGRWRGLNLTYYGLFSANAYAISAMIMYLLCRSAGTPSPAFFTFAAILLTLCMASARFLAHMVEKKRYTFTIGGASFTGLVTAPVLVPILNGIMHDAIPLLPAMAALSVSYACGEGLGRLACISFGCCYGKPVEEAHPLLRKTFSGMSFTFTGKTKKIAYERGLEGRPVIPVQAMTATVCIAAGLAGIYLFLEGFFIWSFLLSLTVTQGWRCLSERMRADHRGKAGVSTYQVMGLASIPIGWTIALFAPNPSIHPVLADGISSLRDPVFLSFVLLFWTFSFLYTGISKVTGSLISFHVHRDRI